MMNKKQFSVLLFLLLCSIMGFARSDEVINLQHIGHHDDRIEYFPPADMPEVYFNIDNLEIIIEADGFSAYYDVEITPTTGYVPLISTQVDGYGDTIDVSSLPDDNYTILITSSNNNQFEGEFTNK